MPELTADALITEVSSAASAARRTPSLLEIAGYPHLENVCSNILAFFLDPRGPHALGPLVFEALLDFQPGTIAGQARLRVHREAVTSQDKRIDILVESPEIVVGIENKIFHSPVNDFRHYSDFLDGLAAGRPTEKILLCLKDPGAGSFGGFKVLKHRELGERILVRLPFYMRHADTRFVTHLLDLINALDNLAGGSMDRMFLDTVSRRYDEVLTFLGNLKNLKTHMRTRTEELYSSFVVPPPLEESSRGSWPKANARYDDEIVSVAYVFVRSPRLQAEIAVEAVLEPMGWEIRMYPRTGIDIGGLQAAVGSAVRRKDARDDRLQFGTRLPYDADSSAVLAQFHGLLGVLSAL